eukprot:3941961-Rhodomonas_salina.18
MMRDQYRTSHSRLRTGWPIYARTGPPVAQADLLHPSPVPHSASPTRYQCSDPMRQSRARRRQRVG